MNLIPALLACLVFQLQGTIIISNPLVTPLPNNTLPYYYANFGSINYDKSFTYDLLVLQVSLCKDNSLKLSSPTFIVTLQDFSANCSDTRQAILAERLGARGLIVSSEYTRYADGQIVLADDGNGRRVNIPCLFISNQTYSQLSQIKSKKIQITANFPLPKANRTTLTFFISASQRISYIFLAKLRQDYAALESSISIEAVYFTYYSEWADQQNCYAGAYCSYDDDNLQPGVGQAVIRQELRQYAILKQEGVVPWLAYMSTFDEVCDYNWHEIDKCTAKVHELTAIQDRGVGNNPLATLEDWRTQEKKFLFQTVPEVAINGMIFRGSFQYTSFMEAVCQSLISPPPYCSSNEQSGNKPENRGSAAAKVVTLLLLTLTVVILGAFWGYRRCVKQEVTVETTGKVNELVANQARHISNSKKKRQSKQHEILCEQL